MKDTNSTYKSRDLYFSSYLFAKRYKLSSIEFDQSGNFYWFIFDEKEKCEQEEQLFSKNEAVVKAKNYSDAVKYLKKLVSEEKGGIRNFKRRLGQ